MFRPKYLILFLVAATMLPGSTAVTHAGEICPELDMALADAGRDAFIETIILLADRLDVTALDQELTYPVRLQRKEHHEIIVTALQEQAAATQCDLVAFLEKEKSLGRVGEFRTFWIGNYIYMKSLPAVIHEAADREDVYKIYFNTPLRLIEPVEVKISLRDGDGVESGIHAIKADSLWALGITGQGRLVSHLDTGVDGSHPAVANRWRGLEPGVTPEEAWFDPVTSTTFPFDSGYHGTHTMGTICGVSGQDSIGVAPEAKWISAAVIDRISMERTKVDAVSAFEWIADPDGDPFTVDDVPDVCSNSWGFSPIHHGVPKCDDFFWDAMDGCEAAGVAVVFAAGNEGSGSETLRTPSDRITSTTNCFSVGALDQQSQNIVGFSSRGPSGCDHVTIKPEVCARGENVRSSMPGGSYGELSGTSMACPHVGGAVALLRQVDPDLTSAQVKELLYETATDLGPAGEDNSYGMGIINLAAAYAYLTTEFGHVEGYVRDAGTQTGLPAEVRMKDTPRRVTAGEDGYYNMGVAGDSSYTFVATYYGYIPCEKQTYVPVEQTVQLDFDLQTAPTGGIAGFVLDEDGDPINGASVTVLATPLESIETGADGYYIFPEVPADSFYTVKAVERNHMPGQESAFVTSGEITSVDFILQSGFFDDFEEGGVDWVHYKIKGLFSDEWHIESSRNYSEGGEWSYKCGGSGMGDYGSRLDCALETPALDLGFNSVFTFQHWIETAEVNQYSVYDGGIIEITTDGGSSWTQIEPDGGYPYTIFFNLFNPFPAGTPCFGSSRDWSMETFDLSSYSGTVSLRFHFGSGVLVDGEGWYIDDVMLHSEKSVLISAEPWETSIPLGGVLRVDIALSNETPEPRTVRASADLFLPSGDPYPDNPITGPVSIELQGDARVEATIPYNIPMSAYLGGYRYVARIEQPPGTLVDQDSFTFEITPLP